LSPEILIATTNENRDGSILWISEIMSFLRKKFHQDHIFKGISNLIFAHE